VNDCGTVHDRGPSVHARLFLDERKLVKTQKSD
jgi:hypothetical protein